MLDFQRLEQEIYEAANIAFRDDLFATCFRVLKMLKEEEFFETTAGGPVMLLFAVRRFGCR